MLAARWLLLVALPAAPRLARALLVVSRAAEQQQEHGESALIPPFDAFLKRYGRAYTKDSGEYSLRRTVYEERAAAATRQNSQQGRLWTAGVSFLWDWTAQEFLQLHGWRRGARPQQHRNSRLVQRGRGVPAGGGDAAGKANATPASLPTQKSWAHLSTFAEVFEQGPCGSCWAVAAARVLQAHTEIHAHRRWNLSAQQLVNCVPNPNHCGGGGGCTGATVELAYAWVMDHGLAETNHVPYEAQEMNCSLEPHLGSESAGVLDMSGAVGRRQRAGAVASSPTAGAAAVTAFGMRSWETLPENKLLPVMRALVEHGPVAASVAATPWQLYRFGIFGSCPKDAIVNHAVVLVGYGVSNETGSIVKFWHLQNSWGPDWGEEGFIRLWRADNEEEEWCGIDDEPEQGTGCDGGPPNVTVCGMCGLLYDNVVPFF